MVQAARICLFASGNGTNARNIALYAAETGTLSVEACIVSNPDIPVVERMKELNIPVLYIDASAPEFEQVLLKSLASFNPDLLVLSGYLKKIPSTVIKAYPKRVINLHPALLPAHGGPGMFGMHVHKAVISSGDKVSGITIHLADEEYDRGQILAQFSTPVDLGDTPESLAIKISYLELKHFPQVITEYWNSRLYSS
jgi:phosphoribosylglycinamide formyltransferase-1